MSRDKVSKAIMFYYDSVTGEYKPVDELSDAGSIYKYIPKIELYWFDESDNGYKPLVTDGTLPLSGGGGIDPSELEPYALKTYVDGKISTLSGQIGTIYATQSYVTTEIGELELSIDGTYLKIADANSTFAKTADVDSTYLKKTQATSDYLSKTQASTDYLTKSGADTEYLKKADATSTYMTKADGADKTYVDGKTANINGIIGDKESLITTDKSSIVGAINEIKLSGGGGSGGEVDLSAYATKVELDTKVDKVADKQLSTEDYTSAEKTKVGTIDNKVDKVAGKGLSTNDYTTPEKDSVATIGDKVDKVAGKQLSTEDYTTAEKNKLTGISAGANNYTLPPASSTVVGGVKISIGTGLEVTGEGTLSATALKNSVDTHIADGNKHVTTTDKAKWNTVGTVSNLTTTNKTDLVSAINEVKDSIGSGGSGGGTPNLELNVKDYGAIGDGVADDTVAIQNALTFAKTNKNKVILPSGRYKTTGTLTVYTGTSFEGMSAEGSIIEYNGNGVAVKFDYDMRDMAMRNFTIKSTNSTSTTSVGLLMEANLFCNVDNIRVLDFNVGYKFDGKDKWCASNYVYNPFSLRCDTGMLLTADEGKQTNHTIVIGGYIVGHYPIKVGAKAIVIEQGDSNKFFGTAVEDYDLGFHFVSENAGGNSLISPRVENCNVSYRVEPNTVNTTILDPFGGVDEADIQSDSFMFLSLKPTFKADNLVWANNVGMKFQSSGRTDWEVFKVTTDDGLEFKAPSWFDSNIEFKVADEANIHQSELTVKQNEVKVRKYLKHGLTDELPVASSEYRGKEIMTQGIAGQADKLMVCMKKEDDTYAWYNRNSYSESPYITNKNALGFGREFLFISGDSGTISNTYNRSIPTNVSQETVFQLEDLLLPTKYLNRLYARFYIEDKTKLSKISVAASNGLVSELQSSKLSNGWNEVPLTFHLGTIPEGNIMDLQFKVRGLNTGDDAGVILNSIGIIAKNNIPTVSLQFDFPTNEVYTKARKIFRDNNMVGSIGVVSSFVGEAGAMEEHHLREMKMMGWSLYNRTASHMNMSTYTKEQAILEVETAKNYLDATYGTGVESSYVAYPEGAFNDNVKLALKEKGMVGRGLSARDELLPNSNKQETCAFHVNESVSLAQAKGQIDLAIAHGSHITLSFSIIDDMTTLLRDLVEYIRSKEDSNMIRVITARDLAKLELE